MKLPKHVIGRGGGPIRATTLPQEAAARKTYPVATGVMDYFPDAICALANVSFLANEQHNPGQPVHWARGKSTDEADTMMRHFLQRGSVDSDGIRHTAKMAWRALALLQKEIEAEHIAGHSHDEHKMADDGCPNHPEADANVRPLPALGSREEYEQSYE